MLPRRGSQGSLSRPMPGPRFLRQSRPAGRRRRAAWSHRRNTRPRAPGRAASFRPVTIIGKAPAIHDPGSASRDIAGSGLPIGSWEGGTKLAGGVAGAWMAGAGAAGCAGAAANAVCGWFRVNPTGRCGGSGGAASAFRAAGGGATVLCARDWSPHARRAGNRSRR